MSTHKKPQSPYGVNAGFYENPSLTGGEKAFMAQELASGMDLFALARRYETSPLHVIQNMHEHMAR